MHCANRSLWLTGACLASIPLLVAIGGTSGGDPSSTAFPSRLEVDYIRVYQKAR